MKEIITLGLKLLLISLIAALALGYANDATKDKIFEQREMANKEARIAVMPDADEFEKIDLDQKGITDDIIQEGYTAIKADSQIGYVFKVTPKGYGGAVEVIVGISNDGKLTGVRIGNMNETPGLGAKSKNIEFYGQYEGMSTANEIGVSKSASSDTEIKAISGATITSKAVTKGVNHAIDAFKGLSK